MSIISLIVPDFDYSVQYFDDASEAANFIALLCQARKLRIKLFNLSQPDEIGYSITATADKIFKCSRRTVLLITKKMLKNHQTWTELYLEPLISDLLELSM